MVYKWLYKEPSTISKHHRDWILGPTQHHDIFPSTSHGYRGLILCRIRAPLQVIQVFGFLTKHRVGIRSSSQGWLKMRNVVIIQLIQLVQLMYVYIYSLYANDTVCWKSIFWGAPIMWNPFKSHENHIIATLMCKFNSYSWVSLKISHLIPFTALSSCSICFPIRRNHSHHFQTNPTIIAS